MALMKYGFGLFITREKKRKRKEESKNSYFLPFSSFFFRFLHSTLQFCPGLFPLFSNQWYLLFSFFLLFCLGENLICDAMMSFCQVLKFQFISQSQHKADKVIQSVS